MRSMLLVASLLFPLAVHADLTAFCTGEAPENAGLLQTYESVCPGFLASLAQLELQKVEDTRKTTLLTQEKAVADAAAAQRAAKIVEAEKSAKAISDLAESIKPDPVAMPTLASFTSASQRQQANLAELVGRDIGSASSTAVASAGPGLVLLSGQASLVSIRPERHFAAPALLGQLRAAPLHCKRKVRREL